MTKTKKTMKTNELIAIFMEFTKDSEELYLIDDYTLRGEDEYQATYVDEMKYKYSWDWLMPVVKKCYDTNNVTCGECGNINHADENDDEIVCKICLHSSERTDFPGLYIEYVDKTLIRGITRGLLDGDIEKTFIAVIEFIKYTRL